VYDERIPNGSHWLAGCRLQHSGTVDRDVTLRVAEQRENRRRLRADEALNFDPIRCHPRIVSVPTICRRLPNLPKRAEVSSWTVAGELRLRGLENPTLVYEPADGTTVHALD